MTDTIIKGINRSYPLLVSAIRKIPVKGAYNAPDITPAIPTSIKLVVGTLGMPIISKVNPNKYPSNPPATREGAKFPPLPPELRVMLVANALKRRVKAK